MRALTITAGIVAALFVTTAAHADAATDKLDELYAMAFGKTPANANASTATASQRLDWYGVTGTSLVVRQLEEEVNRLIAANEKRSALTSRMNALQAQSGTAAVTQAEGGIGALTRDDAAQGREVRSLGWYCTKIGELETGLQQRTQTLADFAVSYIRELRAIPVGRDDSASRVDALTRQFNEQLTRWLDQPANRALAQDMALVRAGVGNIRNASTAFLGAGSEATKAANDLKAEARDIEARGSNLIGLVDRYVERRQELRAELPALRALVLEYSADEQRRTSLINALEATYTPTKSAAQWRAAIDAAVTPRSKAADDAVARIDTLTAGLRTQENACRSMPDPAARFSQLSTNATRQLDSILSSAAGAWAERSTAIDNLDKEHADLIAQNEKQAEDLGRQITAAEARYDSMPAGPERDRLLANIRQARTLGSEAANAAINLRLARQTVQNEKQSSQQAATTFTVSLRASMNALLEVTGN